MFEINEVAAVEATASPFGFFLYGVSQVGLTAASIALLVGAAAC